MEGIIMEFPMAQNKTLEKEKTEKEKWRAVYCDSVKFKGYLAPKSWTLCVGAGISKGIVPDWHNLAHHVVNSAYNLSLSDDEFQKIVSEAGWSLDSWIQAAANKFQADGRESADFKSLIESQIYSIIRSKATGMGLSRYLIQVLSDPHSAPRDRVIEICDFLENTFSGSSLFQTGRALIQCEKSGTAPKAVLTFNADTLLETYINLNLRRTHYLGPGPYGHPEFPFVQVTRPVIKSGNNIPIIHCHGAIAPKDTGVHRHRDSRDRLIFLEQEYLDMASSRASWGESQFLFHAHSTKMVFLGLSMADSNIRKWMNGINIEKSRDLQLFGYEGIPNPHHVWIKPEPAAPQMKQVYLLSLLHLGVRPGWIKSWRDVEAALLNLSSAI
jgi:hypothetical protein